MTEETRAGLATADARALQQGLEALTREPFRSCGRGGPPEPDLYRVVCQRDCTPETAHSVGFMWLPGLEELTNQLTN